VKYNFTPRKIIAVVVPESTIETSPPTHATSLDSRKLLTIQEDYINKNNNEEEDVLTLMTTKGSFVGRKSHSSVIDIHTGSIYILGGTSSMGNDLNDVWILDTFSGTLPLFTDYIMCKV